MHYEDTTIWCVESRAVSVASKRLGYTIYKRALRLLSGSSGDLSGGPAVLRGDLSVLGKDLPETVAGHGLHDQQLVGDGINGLTVVLDVAKGNHVGIIGDLLDGGINVLQQLLGHGVLG